MHLGVFLYGLTGGGATRRVLTLAKGWAERGHRVDLVVVEPRGPLAEETEGLHLVPLDFGRFEKPLRRLPRRWRLFWSRFPLAGYLRTVQPDLLLSAANHAHLPALAAKRMARSRVPLVLRLSNHLSGSARGGAGLKRLWNSLRLGIIKHRYREADFAIAVCEDVRRDFLALVPYPRAQTAVVYNPIEIERIRRLAREEVPHPWFHPKETPIILGAGRLSPQKDFATLIRALAVLKDRTPARLIILGRGKQKKALEKLVRKLALEDRVDLPGFTLNPWAYMARADVFVLSSRWEGLPGVLLEALTVGCPVVSTDCPGGAREILADGRYGPLVPVGDPKALAEAILQVLENPPPREILRKRAEEFDSPRAIAAYLEIFERLKPPKAGVP